MVPKIPSISVTLAVVFLNYFLRVPKAVSAFTVVHQLNSLNHFTHTSMKVKSSKNFYIQPEPKSQILSNHCIDSDLESNEHLMTQLDESSYYDIVGDGYDKQCAEKQVLGTQQDVLKKGHHQNILHSFLDPLKSLMEAKNDYLRIPVTWRASSEILSQLPEEVETPVQTPAEEAAEETVRSIEHEVETKVETSVEEAVVESRSSTTWRASSEILSQVPEEVETPVQTPAEEAAEETVRSIEHEVETKVETSVEESFEYELLSTLQYEQGKQDTSKKSMEHIRESEHASK